MIGSRKLCNVSIFQSGTNCPTVRTTDRVECNRNTITTASRAASALFPVERIVAELSQQRQNIIPIIDFLRQTTSPLQKDSPSNPLTHFMQKIIPSIELFPLSVCAILAFLRVARSIRIICCRYEVQNKLQLSRYGIGGNLSFLEDFLLFL